VTVEKKRFLFSCAPSKPFVFAAPVAAVFLFSFLFLFSCETQSALKTGAPLTQGRTRYSIIYVINGEGSNLYHDEEGRALFADAQMLKQAKEIALEASETEVFIFYLKPAKLHQARGKLYYFRKRLSKKSVIRYTLHSGMSEEISSWLEFYKKYSLRFQEPGVNSRWRSFFFYFGHELQEGKNPVSQSPAYLFTADDLAHALCSLNADFGVDGYGFDLVIVSACNSGTPGIIGTIIHYARYIIASPEPLHLSHISTEPFRNVGEIEKKGTFQFVKGTARYAFERLTRMTNTAVTVAVYDSARVISYIATVEALCMPEKRGDAGGMSFEQIDRRSCGPGEEGKDATGATIEASSIPEYYDCAENPGFREDVMGQGVTVFYRPPLFGREKGKTEHSGWECIRFINADN